MAKLALTGDTQHGHGALVATIDDAKLGVGQALKRFTLKLAPRIPLSEAKVQATNPPHYIHAEESQHNRMESQQHKGTRNEVR